MQQLTIICEHWEWLYLCLLAFNKRAFCHQNVRALQHEKINLAFVQNFRIRLHLLCIRHKERNEPAGQQLSHNFDSFDSQRVLARVEVEKENSTVDNFPIT